MVTTAVGNRSSASSITRGTLGSQLGASAEYIQHQLSSYFDMFGKATCKLCGDNVRFALRHLTQKHPEVAGDKDVAKLNMSRVMEKYFD